MGTILPQTASARFAPHFSSAGVRFDRILTDRPVPPLSTRRRQSPQSANEPPENRPTCHVQFHNAVHTTRSNARCHAHINPLRLGEWHVRCELRGAPNIPGGPFRLRWSTVSDLHIPRTLEWGPSVSVLSAEEHPPGHYALNLQSGDVIRILADSIVLEQ